MAAGGVSLTERFAESFPALRKLRLFLIVHFAALVAFRLITDADDFLNWDLIGFLNANVFPLGALLRHSEVHFLQPFSFPIYNTGAESVLAALIHHQMAGVSLYWSNTVVLAVVDLVFLVALGSLIRLVFTDLYTQCLAWLFVAMSPVVLTFAATSAFNMQAYATIAVALAGCELVLQSRRSRGIALVAAAFLCISQAYPLPFFLPLFCLAWLLCRSVHLRQRGMETGLLANASVLLTVVLGLVVIVQVASGGAYFDRVFSLTDGSIQRAPAGIVAPVVGRVGELLRTAFLPDTTNGTPGFAPYFLMVAAAAAAAFAALVWRRTPRDTRARLQIPYTALAWCALVLFGYLPALNGHPKSQRCFFGDVFLAMSLASAAAHFVRHRQLSRTKLLQCVFALAAISDAFYVSAVAGVDHERPHMPVFDYDKADGLVRHDLDSAIRLMRAQASARNTGLIVYYPRAQAENSTDPAIFHARFLRHFGSWLDRDDIIFPCHVCTISYGCPFPDAGAPCGRRCCYRNPAETLAENPCVSRHRLYLWWFSDPSMEDEPRQSRMLASLRRTYRIRDIGTPAAEKRWHCFELTPRFS